MTVELTINEAGQIELPKALQDLFGTKAGLRLRVEVTEGRIVIVKGNVPVVTETMRTASGRLVLARTGKEAPLVMDGVLENGVLVLPRLGINMDAAAVRAEHLAQPETLAAVSSEDMAHDLVGSLKNLPKDLATNPQYMENFGR